MPRTAPIITKSLLRPIMFVAVFLCAFLGNPASPISAEAAATLTAQVLGSSKIVTASQVKALEQGAFQEADRPYVGFSLHGHSPAVQAQVQGYLFIHRKEALPPHVGRAPGPGFLSRFFPVSIQPNAP